MAIITKLEEKVNDILYIYFMSILSAFFVHFTNVFMNFGNYWVIFDFQGAIYLSIEKIMNLDKFQIIWS